MKAGAFLLIFTISLGFATSSSQGGAYTHPLCPQNNSWLSWKTYFHLNSATRTYARLQLTNIENVPEGEPWRGRCYTIRYSFSSIDEPRYWTVSGDFWDLADLGSVGASASTYPSGEVRVHYTTVEPYEGGTIGVSNILNERGTFGEPNSYELSVRNEIFVFNEAGEVYHRLFGRVGSLTCFSFDAPQNPCLS